MKTNVKLDERLRKFGVILTTTKNLLNKNQILICFYEFKI